MKKTIPTLLLWVALTLPACTPPLPPSQPPAAKDRPSIPAEGSISSRELARRQLAAHLQAGRHQEALTVIDRERRRSGSQQMLEKERLQVLQALTSAGDELFSKGEYERSGQAWSLLLKHYPEERAAVDRLAISRQDLQERLELCAERLMSQGLTNYRAGNLPEAIAAWRKILAFHDAHEGAKRGIQTAEIQLQNLRALP
jgi:tetratricopeptide (TPR) repeat protein